jgi:uncharacterized protein YgiB involved in biofilm formation
MRYVVIAIILGVAGVMVALWFRGECPGGRLVVSPEACRAEQGFTPASCAEVFRRAPMVARSAATVYTDVQACRNDFGECLPHATNTAGVVPRPHGFCVSADSDGRVATIEPVYRRAR